MGYFSMKPLFDFWACLQKKSIVTETSSVIIKTGFWHSGIVLVGEGELVGVGEGEGDGVGVEVALCVVEVAEGEGVGDAVGVGEETVTG